MKKTGVLVAVWVSFMTFSSWAQVSTTPSAAPAAVVAQTPSTSSSATDPNSNAGANNAALRSLGAVGAGKRWGGMVVLDHAVSTGTFVNNAGLRDRSNSITQNWDARIFYNTKLLGKKLMLGVRANLGLSLTVPDSNPGRRIIPYDLRLYATMPSAYVEPVTGVSFFVSAQALLPTSYESLNVTKRRLGVRGLVGAMRSFGPLSINYFFIATKNFNSSKVAVRTSDISRSSDPILSRNANGSVQVASGQANASFDIRNSIGLNYSINDYWSLNWSLDFVNVFRYELYSQTDAFSSAYADAGAGRMDLLEPSLGFYFSASDAFAKYVELPFSLGIQGGISASHPAQTADNKSIMWPFFYNSFGQNRAANNYGSVYLDLVGIF